MHRYEPRHARLPGSQIPSIARWRTPPVETPERRRIEVVLQLIVMVAIGLLAIVAPVAMFLLR